MNRLINIKIDIPGWNGCYVCAKVWRVEHWKQIQSLIFLCFSHSNPLIFSVNVHWFYLMRMFDHWFYFFKFFRLGFWDEKKIHNAPLFQFSWRQLAQIFTVCAFHSITSEYHSLFDAFVLKSIFNITLNLF